MDLPFFTGGNKSNFEHFRWANAGDLPTLRQMVLKAHPSEAFLADQLPQLLNPGLIRVLMMQWGKEQAEIVAMSAARLSDEDEDEYQLVTVIVREDLRDRGLGRKMMNDIVFNAREKAKRKFITTLVPEYKTFPEDEESILEWYQKMQFAATGVVERDAFFRDGSRFDGYLFERTL